MSETVKRYVTTCDCMSPAAWGDYVRYDDYATLEAENAKLRAELEAIADYPENDIVEVRRIATHAIAAALAEVKP